MLRVQLVAPMWWLPLLWYANSEAGDVAKQFEISLNVLCTRCTSKNATKSHSIQLNAVAYCCATTFTYSESLLYLMCIALCQLAARPVTPTRLPLHCARGPASPQLNCYSAQAQARAM